MDDICCTNQSFARKIGNPFMRCISQHFYLEDKEIVGPHSMITKTVNSLRCKLGASVTNAKLEQYTSLKAKCSHATA